MIETMLLHYMEKDAKINTTTLAHMLAVEESEVLDTLSELENQYKMIQELQTRLDDVEEKEDSVGGSSHKSQRVVERT